MFLHLLHISLSSHFVLLTVFLVSFSQAVGLQLTVFSCLPPVGEVGSVVCVGFLVEWTGACVWWVGLDLVLLMGRAVSGGTFLGVCELSMTLGSLSANG